MKASTEVRRWVSRVRRRDAKPNGVISYLWDAPVMERKVENDKKAQPRDKRLTEFDLS
jgi:hypothetical protein